MARKAPTQANFFDLKRGTVSITFSATDFGGQPNLSLAEGSGSRTFRGDEITIQKTALGTLLTVTLEAIPDLESKLLSVLLPDVNVGPKNRERVTSVVIHTTERTSIGGPNLVVGAIQIYKKAQIFRGYASFVLT
jgi:hypothetical protein